MLGSGRERERERERAKGLSAAGRKQGLVLKSAAFPMAEVLPPLGLGNNQKQTQGSEWRYSEK